MSPQLVMVTAPDLPEARKLAEMLLEKRLAACVNLIPAVESHYWWQGKRETASEVLLLIKSSAQQWEALSEAIKADHSYACPEIVAFQPGQVAPAYLAWWTQEMGGEE